MPKESRHMLTDTVPSHEVPVRLHSHKRYRSVAPGEAGRPLRYMAPEVKASTGTRTWVCLSEAMLLCCHDIPYDLSTRRKLISSWSTKNDRAHELT